MELIPLNDFLRETSYLRKGDYIYEHNNERAPVNNEMDISKLYQVWEADGHKLQIYSMASKDDMIEINLETLTGFWWILRLPDNVRKCIGLPIS